MDDNLADPGIGLWAVGRAPIDRGVVGRAAMLALPPVAPATGWRNGIRLARDHYIRALGQILSGQPAPRTPSTATEQRLSCSEPRSTSTTGLPRLISGKPDGPRQPAN